MPDIQNMAPEDTKTLLIAAAKKLFAEKGFDGTTVKEVAELAGVNISLVSYHFSGKENLYRTIIEEFGLKRLSSSERILKTPLSADDFRVRLTLFLEDFYEDASRDSEITMIMNRECMGSHPMTTDIFEKTFLKSFQYLIDFLTSAQESGFVSEKIVPHLSALVILGGAVQIIHMDPMHQKIRGYSNIHDHEKRNALIQNTIQMLTKGLFG